MDITAQKLIEYAMTEIGARDRDDPLDSSDAAMVLDLLNMMLGSMSAGPLSVRALVTESKELTAGTGSYTIGTGGAWNTAKPYRMVSAYVRDSDGYDTPVGVREKEWYETVGDKAQQARPEYVTFDPGLTQQASQLGTIYLLPVPDSTTTYTLYCSMLKQLTEFASLTSAVTFEPPYYEYLLYKLANRIWRPFHDGAEPVPADLIINMNRAEKVVENLNSRKMTMRMDVPGSSSGAPYNIYTDT